MPREIPFPAVAVTAVLTAPTLLILTRHPGMGAATLGGILLAWVVHTRLVTRAEPYAPRPADPEPVDWLPGLRPRVPLDDDEDLFFPDDDGSWVHLNPSYY